MHTKILSCIGYSKIFENIGIDVEEYPEDATLAELLCAVGGSDEDEYDCIVISDRHFDSVCATVISIREHSNIPIVCVTRNSFCSEKKTELLVAGADDIIFDVEVSENELAASVFLRCNRKNHALCRRLQIMLGGQSVDFYKVGVGWHVTLNGMRLCLTPKESVFLHLMFSSPNRTLTNEYIIRAVADSKEVTLSYPKFMAHKVRKKLKESGLNIDNILVNVFDIGYQFVKPI
jgi:DNA-binding response OmpR family regulator